MSSRDLKTAGLALVASVFVLVATGCAVMPQGARWWNPTTWFTRTELKAQERAERKQEAAELKVEVKTDEAVHASHKEFFKSNLVLTLIPPTPDVELARRFSRNGLGLLAQTDPLTAAESAELFGLVQDLRSGDAKRIADAEARQAKAESQINQLSTDLEKARAEVSAATAKNKALTADLQQAFLRENELADTLRNQRFLTWTAIVGVVLLSGLALYLRIGMGSVGAVMHGLPKLIGPEAASKVIQTLDTETDWFHQVIIGGARKKLADKVAKAKATVEAVLQENSTPPTS